MSSVHLYKLSLSHTHILSLVYTSVYIYILHILIIQESVQLANYVATALLCAGKYSSSGTATQPFTRAYAMETSDRLDATPPASNLNITRNSRVDRRQLTRGPVAALNKRENIYNRQKQHNRSMLWHVFALRRQMAIITPPPSQCYKVNSRDVYLYIQLMFIWIIRSSRLTSKCENRVPSQPWIIFSS